MRTRLQSCSGKKVLRLLAVAALASTAVACGSDSSRFGENPFTNPFAAAANGKVDRIPTGSLPTRSLATRTAPLAAVSSQPLPPVLSRSVSNPLNPVGAALPVSQPLPRVASATLQQASPIAGSGAGWTASGGTPVTVGAGETAATLSARYGVPTSAITAANGGQLRPGQQAIIPVYSGSGAAPQAANPVRQPSFAPPKPIAAAPTVGAAKPIAPLKPLTPEKDDDEEDEPAKKATVQPAAPFAAAPSARGPILAAKPVAPPKSTAPEKDDDDEEEPTKKAAASAAKPIIAAAPKANAAKSTIVAAKPAKPLSSTKQAEADDDDEDEKPVKKVEKPATVAKAPARVIPLTQQVKPVEPDEKVATAPKAEVTTTQSIAPAAKSEDKPEFRWPAKGRVISGFGSKGGNGDGISIAVPEGTPVKAAEGGTVAYAGEELKGYGKLVLVRHDNGYVSAYAHNGELNVKRGEKVSRGQLLAKSGSSGNVTSPQLHFELRKGSTPVDPTKYLEN
jgi:murein DD-endopeptidase MepM/ murein hydrolase activator NlpD